MRRGDPPYKSTLRQDFRALGWGLVWLGFYGLAGALMWRGLLAFGFPVWLAPFLLAGALWALYLTVQDARRRRRRTGRWFR